MCFSLAGQNNSDYSYSIEDKDAKKKGQEVSIVRRDINTHKWGIGIKALQQFNMPVMHSILAINFRKGNSDLYLGPHFTYISEKRLKGEDEVNFSQNTYGLNFGYRYTLDTKNRKLNVFLQLDFSIYEAEKWYYTELYSGVASNNEVVLENCISVGLSYLISKQTEIFTGYGMGSTEGFFLLFEGMIPQIYFGVQFNLN